MKTFLAGAAILAATFTTTVPASAQRIDLGYGGPSIDLRSRGQRERDYNREVSRRDRYEDRGYYRRERYDDDRGRYNRRGYDY
ncbi:hypothetical protein [Methylobacterium sp. A54F]